MSSREFYSNLKNQSLVEPRESEKFYPSKVQALIKENLEYALQEFELTADNMNNKTKEINRLVKEAVRNGLNMPRYKLVVQTVLGSIEGQGLTIASKCLWDINCDNYSSYTLTTEKLYCTTIVFGCYNE